MFAREFLLSGVSVNSCSPVDCGVLSLSFNFYSFHMVEKAIFENLPALHSLNFYQHSFDGSRGLNSVNLLELRGIGLPYLLSRYSET